MRVEYINPFVETSFRVLQEVLGGAEVKRGDLYLKSTAMPVMGVAALVGLAGDVEGRVLFDMTMETALNIASAMNGETLPEFDDLAKATISELANLTRVLEVRCQASDAFRSSCATFFWWALLSFLCP